MGPPQTVRRSVFYIRTLEDLIEKLDIQSTGMEFALEMIVKAGMHHLKICEVPTTLSLDAKGRVPHLRTYRDGWRSLRFFLTMSPHWVFTYPGFASLLVGLPSFVLLYVGPVKVGGVVFDYHTLLYAAAAIIFGIIATNASIQDCPGQLG